MTYRDDREALHARTASLEAELADAHRELSWLRARNDLASEEADRLRDTIERLSLEQRALTPPPFVRPRPWWVWAYVAAVIFGMMSFVAFAGSARRVSMLPTGAYMPRSMGSLPPIDLGMLGRGQVDPARVELGAKVIEAHGRELAAGTECTVRAEVGAALDGLIAKIDVDCPGAPGLYRWSDPVVGGVSVRECLAFERQTAEGADGRCERGIGCDLRYAFDCRDEGARTAGRPQLRLETSGARLDVWQDEGASPFHVSFEVEALSSASSGAALLSADARARQAFVPFDREGHVESVTGRGAPAEVGDLCTVRVEAPADSGFNCRVFVRCAGELIYGAGSTGYMTCSLDDEGRPVSGSDESIGGQDGDATVSVDLAAGRLVLGDRSLDGPWSMVVTGPWGSDGRSLRIPRVFQ